MKVEEMKRLLDAFYAGTTDEHEEELLREALRTTSVSGHLLSGKRILLALERLHTTAPFVPEGLEERLSQLIDQKDEEEPHFIRRNRTRRSWRWVAGVAATFLLLFGVGWGVIMVEKKPVPPTSLDTFSDPQEAYRVLQATFCEMSSNWRAGIGQMQEVQSQMSVVQKEVKQELSK